MSQARPNISIPILNPIRLYDIANSVAFTDSLPDFYSKSYHEQIYEQGDTLQFQLKIENSSEWSPAIEPQIWAGLYDVNGVEKYTIYVPLLYIELGGWYYYFCNKKLYNIAAGVYQLRINIQNIKQSIPNVVVSEYNIYSEPILIKATHQNSVLLRYTHENNNKGMMFVHPVTEAQFNYQMRVQGGFLPTEFTPASKDTYYRDQSYDLTNLKSIPYNVQRLTIGDGGGVPNYIADIVNRIFSCSYISIDDLAFVKSDGSKFERKGAELIGKAAWKIEVEEAVNVDSYTSIWLQQVQVTTATVTDNAVALMEAGYELENGYVLQLGDIVAVLEQTTKSDNGIYVVGETVAELTHHEKYPTDVSCDKVIALLDFPDKYDNYIYALYYDYSKSELMAVTYLKYATEDKAAFVMTGETKEIVFGATLYSVPTIINITLWDATGQPVVGGYTVTSVTVNGMTIVCNGNNEELTGNYYVKC